MIRDRVFNCFLALLLLFVCLFVSAKSMDVKVGVSKIDLALTTSDIVNVVVEVVELPKDYIYRRKFVWGGDEVTPPRRVVKAISILEGGRIIFVPLSTYADLGDPGKIRLEKLSSREFRLVISGGDAAGSYSAMLYFKEGEIVRRKVVSNEFPENVWEETTFSFNNLNN